MNANIDTITAGTRRITLENTFHGTAATVLAHVDERGALLLTHRQARRAWRRLCGIQGCTCSRVAGDRMPGLRSEQIQPDAAFLYDGCTVILE